MKSILILLSIFSLVSSREFCTPNDAGCWPSDEEIESFKLSLSSPTSDCLDFVPTFSSKSDPGELIYNYWFGDMGPFLTAWEMMNLRNYIRANAAYFVVTARNADDVSKAVMFATAHNLAISVFGTGHEFQDRNSGLAPDGLLIRTVCLRSVQVDLEDNQLGHADGVVKMGSGMTWGTSVFGLKGMQEIARDHDRVIVHGNTAQVGFVGFALAGGHGPLSPYLGLGVDQVLEVELVGPDGSLITANHNGTSIRAFGSEKFELTENSDLFWALRGGGAGPWGVVTAMTFKLHKPRKDCSEECYQVTDIIWANTFDEDGGRLAGEAMLRFLIWASQASKFWTAYFQILLDSEVEGGYLVKIRKAMYSGSKFDLDALNIENFFSDYAPDKVTKWETVSYDTYYERTLLEPHEPIVAAHGIDVFASVMLNSTVLENQAFEFADVLMNHWFPNCLKGPEYVCTDNILMHRTFPLDDNDNQETSLSRTFREADLHITTGGATNLDGSLSFEDKIAYMHDDLAPAMYAFGEGCYYNEAEYSMSNWEERLWDRETYSRLLEIKETWDPEGVFGCRHCVGDGQPPIGVNHETMPTWRRLQNHH